VIEQRLQQKGLVSHVDRDQDGENETATTNVVDFMSLLQQSLASNKRTPAAKSAAKAAGKVARAASAGGPAKKAAPAKKSVAKAAKTSAKKVARPAGASGPRRKSA